MKVRYSYLERQFADIETYLQDILEVVRRGDFTLGKEVAAFEERFASLSGHPHAIGVGTGTDALVLALEAAGIGHGDEVITCPNTFVATVGAIATAGARPAFVDCDEDFTIDVDRIESAITEQTRAILPVHLTGCPADLPSIMDIARRHDLIVVEDAAQAIGARRAGEPVGSWGVATGFSLHPLKNLNVWGDAGVIVTRSEAVAERLRLLRNHGMKTRDEIVLWGHNSRLDTIQAAVGLRLIEQVEEITERRIENAGRFDAAFAELEPFVRIPPRRPNVRQVFHTYVLRVQQRDALLAWLREAGVGAKVHYPIPLHLQPAAANLGYRAGDFPRVESDAREILTLPVHQHLTEAEIEYIIERVRSFYGAGPRRTNT